MPSARTDSLDAFGRRTTHRLSPLIKSAVGGTAWFAVAVAILFDGGGGRTIGTLAVRSGSQCPDIEVFCHPALRADKHGGVRFAVARIYKRIAARPRRTHREFYLPIDGIYRQVRGGGDLAGVRERIGDTRSEGDPHHAKRDDYRDPRCNMRLLCRKTKPL